MNRLRSAMVIGMIAFFFVSSTDAQTDWQRWGKAEVSYEIETTTSPTARISHSGVGSFFVSAFQVGYTYLFSNYDGDNCPFYPTCSAFFVQSVKETNLLKGFLMFADRFTRDTNMFKRYPHYPMYKTGRLFDPVHNYKLRPKEIKIYPRDIIVK